MSADPALPGWIADPALHPAWKRILDQFERAGLEARGAVEVPLTTREERHAVGALLGRSVTRTKVRIELAQLDARLRARSGIGGLPAVLTALFGSPPQDRPAARAARDAARERPLALAAELVDAPWAAEWIEGMRRAGLLTRAAGEAPERVVREAAIVLGELTGPSGPTGPQRSSHPEGANRPLGGAPDCSDRPLGDRQSLSRVELAARLLGDSHALDRDRLLHRVVLRGLAAASAIAPPEGARESEDLWARFGVEPDLLSRTCLVWGLRVEDAGPMTRRLNASAQAGDPVHITAWDLRRVDAFAPLDGCRVLVCENPGVLEAIASRRIHGWAAVCTAGEPNLVVASVLASLAQAGASLHYHGDFDWPGIAIANRAIVRHGVAPFCMAAEDYVRAVRGDAPELRGATVEPSWDPELGAAMRSHQRAVHEESVLAELLHALAIAA